jgi:hypothetical protein
MDTQMAERSPGNAEYNPSTQQPKPEHAEGQVARTIEQQTAKLPSDTFLWAAVGSIVGSLTLQLMGKQKPSTSSQ